MLPNTVTNNDGQIIGGHTHRQQKDVTVAMGFFYKGITWKTKGIRCIMLQVGACFSFKPRKNVTALWCRAAILVCMNTFISETINARATKFGDHICNSIAFLVNRESIVGTLVFFPFS